MLEHKDFIDQMLRCAPIRPPTSDITFDASLGAYEVYNHSNLTYLGDLNPPGQDPQGPYSRNGMGINYYQSGQIHIDGSFKNDIISGDFCRIFYPTGELFFAGSVKHGFLLEGELFFPNRQIQYKGKFCGGFIDGEKVEIFSSSGGLRYQGGVRRGRYDGDAILYHSNGGICVKGRFKAGELCDENVQMFFESGAMFYQGCVVGGKREGYGALYYDKKEGKIFFFLGGLGY